MPPNPNKRRCKARSKIRDDDGVPIMIEGRYQFKPCQNWAVKGAEVCDVHGGRLPAVKKAAARRRAETAWEARVGEMLDWCELPAENPIDGLLEAVQRAGAMMRMLGSLVEGLDTKGARAIPGDDGEVVYTLGWDALYGPDHKGDGAPHVLVKLYEQWHDRYAKACKLALDANIDERQIQIVEQQAQLFAGALRGILSDLRLSPEQKSMVPEVVRRHLSALPASSREVSA